MKLIAVTQRVAIGNSHGERRDALDQRWVRFLEHCGYTGVPVPNDPRTILALIKRLDPAGILLTGGNDLHNYGGDAPERDQTENALLDWAAENKRPVIGICRGMQVILHQAGVKLVRIEGHVGESHSPKLHEIEIDGRTETVNSYHGWGARRTRPPLEAWAKADDGVLEAVRRKDIPVIGLMWHPERCEPFTEMDRKIFRDHFGA